MTSKKDKADSGTACVEIVQVGAAKNYSKSLGFRSSAIGQNNGVFQTTPIDYFKEEDSHSYYL